MSDWLIVRMALMEGFSPLENSLVDIQKNQHVFSRIGMKQIMAGAFLSPNGP